MTCTTMVRSGGSSCLFLSFGGCGTNASRPFGVSGVMTMKMISSTSSTSTNGVTLMSAFCPPAPPTAIAITGFSFVLLRHRRRLRFLVLLLDLFGQQADLVHSCSTHVIHYLYHRAVLVA